MTQKVSTRYVMTGAFKGQTVQLGKFLFVAGVFDASRYSEKDLAKLDLHFAQWEAYRNGDSSLQEAGSKTVPGLGESVGGEGTSDPKTPDGGQPVEAKTGNADGRLDAAGDRQTEKLKEAIQSLDPKADADWTSAGKPAITAVERALGRTGLTRKVIEAALPGFTRPDIMEG